MSDDQIKENSSTGALMEEDEGQLVVFKLADEEFGVDINQVKEIIRLPEITPIPRSPNYVAGICNLRGDVLPVIESRIRFSLGSAESTERTRLLVVENRGVVIGLVVDEMKEVMRMSGSIMEPPPAVCQNIDKEYLDGVVKMDEGKRLVLKLNLNEVIHVEISETDKQAASKSLKAEQEKTQTAESLEEEHLVSFQVAKEEYAFDIEKVREILRVTEITSVPNASDYVNGLFTVRNELLPVLDLRKLLGIKELVKERCEVIDELIEEAKAWSTNLKNAFESENSFTGGTSFKKSTFGLWFGSFNTSSAIIQGVVKKLQKAYVALYIDVEKHFALSASKEDNLSFYQKKVNPVIDSINGEYRELKLALEEHMTEDQRILVVSTGDQSIGYLVDNVNEVIRIPKSVIDEAPDIASSQRKELKGVARLSEGERLIMIMDENALISSEEQEKLSGITSKKSGEGEKMQEEQKDSLEKQSLEEEQLVTFVVGEEEYGIQIMDVQEINRLEEITSVPRAPFFIEGVTNLRGNVIPVVDLRKLFNLETKEKDDRTRIIIADINNTKTGLRVDQVNEVLRLSKKDIDPTPSILSSDGSSAFMEGVCKINNGERMIVLLDVKKILNKDELKLLSSMDQGPKSESKLTKKKEQEPAQETKAEVKEDENVSEVSESSTEVKQNTIPEEKVIEDAKPKEEDVEVKKEENEKKEDEPVKAEKKPKKKRLDIAE